MDARISAPWVTQGIGCRSLAAALVLLLAGTTRADDGTAFDLGRPVSDAEIARIDIDIMPDGRGLPPGAGDVATGEALFARTCARCHGEGAVGGPNGGLAGEALHDPAELAADRARKHTVGNYWPYATTLFDYIRRAMPYDQPGSLADDEVYALTAYVLHRNGIIDDTAVMNARTLPTVEMPARPFFVPAAAMEGDS